MSALGQKQTLCCVTSMSALPPKADIGTQSWNVRFVPTADIDRLFDHLVSLAASLCANLQSTHAARNQASDYPSPRLRHLPAGRDARRHAARSFHPTQRWADVGSRIGKRAFFAG